MKISNSNKSLLTRFNRIAKSINILIYSFSIPGLIYDLTKSYNLAFFLSGLSPIVGASVLMLIYRIPSDRSPTVPEDDDEEYEDIGDVFYEDKKEPAGRKNSDYGRLKREPSVRRPSRKSTVTFSDDHHVTEETSRLVDTADGYVPPWKQHAIEMVHEGMGKKRRGNVEVKSNEHTSQNGDIHLHRTHNGEMHNGEKPMNGHVTYPDISEADNLCCDGNDESDVQESVV